MSALRYGAIRLGFEALALSRIPALVRRFSSCRGVILTLHRVLPELPADFAPNAILQVTPSFLDAALKRFRRLGVDIVSLDEALTRLAAPERGRPFVVLTFDDAYRDNLKFALPVLRRHRAPFTLYVPTAFVDGTGVVWWQALEDIIAEREAIAVPEDDETNYLPTTTTAEKEAAFRALYRRMRTTPEPERVALMALLADQYGLDLAAHCRSLVMDWSELAAFARDPLCTIGAHTVHHYELSKLPPAQVRSEITQSVRVIEAQFGVAPTHLSYPIGGKASAGQREYRIAEELGLRSAVTTLPGGLYPRHLQSLHALPRVSLNGLFQAPRYVDVFATGALFSRMPG
ncbi:polysaccharide deacetylase [Arsenicitalea aurantiaca]|uniref:Chitooligosaccharide deacetylase n=1 Tax=Arsenicitalea aurantiaca TaxID=1783274 RepID=A0A433XEL6_9HYPH|nr:polysaccharide deacetylase family protein [Arsenicitalea aurantiaca]RUT32557.1 polysaccharide deacetylase [Arsenicitalea aurantiaca]